MRPPRRAFALLLTLVLLALAGTVLATVTRRIYAEVEQAHHAQAELQRRWASATLAPLVDRADEVLTADGAASAPGLIGVRRPASREIKTTLGGLAVSLTFADEQAKLPVHHLVAEHGPDETTRRLRGLLPGELATRVWLRPIDTFTARLNGLPLPPQTPAFHAFSQVMTAAVNTPDRLDGEDARLLAGSVTLWGGGKLNLRRVDPQTLQAALSPDLDLAQARQLTMLATDPASLDETLRRLALSDRVRQRVRSRLTTQSEVHSLWITLTDDHRAFHELIVHEHGPANRSRRLHW